MRILALHGFGGNPSDWDFLKARGLSVEALSLDGFSRLDLWDAGRAVCNFARESREQQVLLGYSLGARLALHALLLEPELFRAACFVSVNLGLATESARRAREQQDEIWAREFEQEPWESVRKRWNDQPVFRGSRPRTEWETLETGYPSERAVLVRQMRNFSLGRQAFLAGRLAAGKRTLPRMLFVAGEHDAKFRALLPPPDGERVRTEVLAGAGHRAPFDVPELFASRFTSFLYAANRAS